VEIRGVRMGGGGGEYCKGTGKEMGFFRFLWKNNHTFFEGNTVPE